MSAMSANSGAVPDAWEDSWETQADVCNLREICGIWDRHWSAIKVYSMLISCESMLMVIVYRDSTPILPRQPRRKSHPR